MGVRGPGSLRGRNDRSEKVRGRITILRCIVVLFAEKSHGYGPILRFRCRAGSWPRRVNAVERGGIAGLVPVLLQGNPIPGGSPVVFRRKVQILKGAQVTMKILDDGILKFAGALTETPRPQRRAHLGACRPASQSYREDDTDGDMAVPGLRNRSNTSFSSGGLCWPASSGRCR